MEVFNMTRPPLIATAGWSIPRDVTEQFPSQGSGLERYAACFGAVEVNSTFYRSHRATTYARWYAATPAAFRFAVKLPRAITHHARLAVAHEPLAAFRDEVAGLKEKLGPLLVQLPPGLALELSTADRFFSKLREIWPGAVACEPRHPTWFEANAEALLSDYEIGRVAADPAPHPASGAPGGWKGLAYWRLHGSPRMYYSAYGEADISALASKLRETVSRQTWCVFDNTASGAAAANALDLRKRLSAPDRAMIQGD
jgi:uncharacterized protein YecE (DUF72 family)